MRTRVPRIQTGVLSKVYDEQFNELAIRSSSSVTQYGYTRAQAWIASRKVKWRDTVNLKDVTSQASSSSSPPYSSSVVNNKSNRCMTATHCVCAEGKLSPFMITFFKTINLCPFYNAFFVCFLIVQAVKTSLCM